MTSLSRMSHNQKGGGFRRLEKHILSLPKGHWLTCALDALQNQWVVGRALTRHVGLKPDLRPNGLSGFIRPTASETSSKEPYFP